MAAPKKVTIGILGSAQIAHKFMAGQKTLDSCEVLAIASRTKERATAFATKWSIPKSYSSYQELIDDPSIELIYIPLPTSLHKEWTIKSAQKGKHVICEKPLAPNYEDALEMVKECLKNNVQFMDGTYWTHANRTQIIHKHFSEIGGVQTVSSKFTWAGMESDNIRRNFDTEPLGALGDLGWYCARATLFGFNYYLPDYVFGTASYKFANEPNYSFTGLMWYNDGRSAHYDCTFGESTRQWVEYSGSEGCIYVDDFVIPWNSQVTFNNSAEETPESISKFKVVKYPGKSREVSVNWKFVEEQDMIEDMCKIVRSGKLDPFWVEAALKTHLLLILSLKSAKDGVPITVPKELGI